MPPKMERGTGKCGRRLELWVGRRRLPCNAVPEVMLRPYGPEGGYSEWAIAGCAASLRGFSPLRFTGTSAGSFVAGGFRFGHTLDLTGSGSGRCGSVCGPNGKAELMRYPVQSAQQEAGAQYARGAAVAGWT